MRTFLLRFFVFLIIIPMRTLQMRTFLLRFFVFLIIIPMRTLQMRTFLLRFKIVVPTRNDMIIIIYFIYIICNYLFMAFELQNWNME